MTSCCRICQKEIEGAYLPEGDMVSYSHPTCYVSEWRHMHGQPCGHVLCPDCGDPRSTSIDVVRLATEALS